MKLNRLIQDLESHRRDICQLKQSLSLSFIEWDEDKTKASETLINDIAKMGDFLFTKAYSGMKGAKPKAFGKYDPEHPIFRGLVMIAKDKRPAYALGAVARLDQLIAYFGGLKTDKGMRNVSTENNSKIELTKAFDTKVDKVIEGLNFMKDNIPGLEKPEEAPEKEEKKPPAKPKEDKKDKGAKEEK